MSSNPNIQHLEPDLDASILSIPSISSFPSKGTKTGLIIGNPMHSPQCRNALLDRHNLDINHLLSYHLPAIYGKDDEDIDDDEDGSHRTKISIEERIDFLQNRKLPQLWGREQLNALQNNVEWWSGHRVHASFDPFWYFELDGNQTDSQLKSQRAAVRRRGNKMDRERVVKEFHFSDQNISGNLSHPNSDSTLHFATYDVTKPIEVDGYVNTFREHTKMNQVTYYHVPKCGSTSIRNMLQEIGGTRIMWRQSWFDGYSTPSSLGRDIECGFTFVRHPIHRFISAYYTVEHMLRFDSKQMGDCNLCLGDDDRFQSMRESLKHWDMVDVCFEDFSCFDRLYVFVNQLVEESWKWINKYEDVLSIRVMEHMGSISGHFMAGYDGWNIDYVGKVEQFGEHWSVLSQEITECKTGYLEKYWDQKQGEESSTKRKLRGEKDTETTAADKMRHAGQKGHHTLNRTLVDAYYALAMDKTIYDKLVEYYYQDFVCFDYDMSYDTFLDYINQHDPEFDPQRLRPLRMV